MLSTNLKGISTLFSLLLDAHNVTVLVFSHALSTYMTKPLHQHFRCAQILFIDTPQEKHRKKMGGIVQVQ